MDGFNGDAVPVEDSRDVALVVDVDILEVQCRGVESKEVGDKVCFEVL